MMKQKIKFLLLMAAIAVLSTAGLKAQTTLQIGSNATGQLKVEVTNEGRFLVSREGRPQMYYLTAPYTIPSHVFGFKIGGTQYTPTNYGGTQLTQETVSYENAGTMQHITKKYSGTYSSQPFSVTWKISYNTSNPDFLTMEATIDARNIPVTPTPIRIRLAYAFDAYVNSCDAGAAYVLPDFLNKNGTQNSSQTTPISSTMTKAQTRQLNLVSVKNTVSPGSLIGFFPMGRSFDFACAEGPMQASEFIDAFNSTNVSYFRFGVYNPECRSRGPWDSGVGVNYDSIPAGQITTIYTGMTFTTDLMGGLNYSWKTNDWSNANDTTVQVPAGGKDLNLRLRYDSYSPVAIPDLKFQVDLPQGLQMIDTPIEQLHTGFNAFDATIPPSLDFFRVNLAGIGAAGTKAYVTLPVHFNSYGQYRIDANSISHVSKTLPIGDPAILTATTTVDFAPVSDPVLVAPGASAKIKVKLPDGVVANGDLVISLGYNPTSGFPATLPATVTIPNGQNEGEFTVQAFPTALDGTSLKITLTATDSQYVTCENTEIDLEIGRKRYAIPVNPSTRFRIK